MDGTRLRRILVALEPAVLEGALALLLEDGRRNDVVQYHQATEADRVGSFDAVIVTRNLLPDVRADVVITLPDGAEVTGVGTVTSRGAQREVQLRSSRQVIDLLDDFEVALAASPGAPSTAG